MKRPWTKLYVHLVWATWDRVPLLVPELIQRVYACLFDECEKLSCEAIAVDGTDDHIHVLARFPTTVTIAGIAKQLKGSSSHLVTHRIPGNATFKWQGGYGAFTVSRHDVPVVEAYVKNQLSHHNRADLREELERIWIEDT
jgi:REP element-mobilizing transposase RayT